MCLTIEYVEEERAGGAFFEKCDILRIFRAYRRWLAHIGVVFARRVQRLAFRVKYFISSFSPDLRYVECVFLSAYGRHGKKGQKQRLFS